MRGEVTYVFVVVVFSACWKIAWGKGHQSSFVLWTLDYSRSPLQTSFVIIMYDAKSAIYATEVVHKEITVMWNWNDFIFQ